MKKFHKGGAGGSTRFKCCTLLLLGPEGEGWPGGWLPSPHPTLNFVCLFQSDVWLRVNWRRKKTFFLNNIQITTTITSIIQYQNEPVQWHKGQGKGHPYDSFEGSTKEGGWAVQGPLSIAGHFSEERLNFTFSLLIFAVLNLTWLKWKEQPRIWWVGNTSFHSSRIATYHLRFYNSQIVPKPQNLPLQAHFLETEGPLAPAAANSFLNKKKNTIAKPGTGQCKALNKHLSSFWA